MKKFKFASNASVTTITEIKPQKFPYYEVCIYCGDSEDNYKSFFLKNNFPLVARGAALSFADKLLTGYENEGFYPEIILEQIALIKESFSHVKIHFWASSRNPCQIIAKQGIGAIEEFQAEMRYYIQNERIKKSELISVKSQHGKFRMIGHSKDMLHFFADLWEE